MARRKRKTSKQIDQMIAFPMPVGDRDDLVTVTEETAVAGTYRQRRLDLTEQWVRAKVIDAALHEAALMFAYDFHSAGLRGSYSSEVGERVDQGSGDVDRSLVRILEAKRRIAEAMGVMGQVAGDTVWDIIGNEMSIREYVVRKSSMGRGLNGHEVRGRVVVGLDLLAGHYGCK